MLSKLKVENFVVFDQQEFEFGPGLNVFVGENGTGKSSILRALYALFAAGTESSFGAQSGAVYERFRLLFGVRDLAQIVKNACGKRFAKLCLHFYSDQEGERDERLIEVALPGQEGYEAICHAPPQHSFTSQPIFLSSNCVVNIRQSYFAIGSERAYPAAACECSDELRFPGILNLLSFIPSLDKCPKRLEDLKVFLENLLNGSVVFGANGRLYLKFKDDSYRDLALLGSGLRKLALLDLLVSTGILDEGRKIIWEEPETGLNPKLLKELAKVVYILHMAELQLFISTHSLFFLRELGMLLDTALPRPYYFGFGFEKTEDDGKVKTDGVGNTSVQVSVGKSACDIGSLTVVDEEVEQSDRYLKTEQETLSS